MEEKIKNWIKEVLDIKSDFVLQHPKDLKNGDYSLVLPVEDSKEYFEKLKKNKIQEIEKVEAVGRFINFYLSREFFSKSIEKILNEGNNVGKNEILSGKKIMIEYTDPNPFKPFHIGHLMTNAIGESIARILEHSGADVSRANYQGDIGLHVAKAFFGMQKKGMPKDMNAPVAILAEYIGDSYVLGSEAYDTDAKAKEEIDILNKKIYDRSDEEVNQVYDWGFKVTMEAFEDLYKLLGTKFDYYFLESAMADIGRDIVGENMDRVFEKSDGAVVFHAEKYDPKLHTRVFITSAGLPTYETKELGLVEEKFKTDPDTNISIVVTANEQAEYMKVVEKAIAIIDNPKYKNREMKHITHGMMRFASGKMSSRKGNVVTGESLLKETIALVAEKIEMRDWEQEEKQGTAEVVGVAAIKYSILKQNTGGDIIYDFENSISFEGDSGPYLQYSFARANSVLGKAQKENILPDFENVSTEIFEVEKMLYRFDEVVRRAVSEYEPHYIANYLIEVARAFNSFYGNTVIVNKEDKNSPYKVALTYAFSSIMKNGLHLLGIEAPRKM